MMKKLLTLIFAAPILALAQPKEKIEYYTDDKVDRSIVSFQVHYTGGFANRRVLSEEYDVPVSAYYRLEAGNIAGYAQALGGDFVFRVTGNIDLSVGLNYSSFTYTWDGVKFLDYNLPIPDTLEGTYRVKVNANYFNVPIQFGFVSEISDQWWLLVYPGLDLGFLQKLTRTPDINMPGFTPNPENFGDIKDKGRQFNLSINFGLGGEYRALPKLGIFTRVQFRYSFFPLIENDFVSEIPYTFGLQTGVRFYF